MFASPAVFFVGLLVGVMEVYVLNKFFNNKSFTVKLLFKLITYVLLLFIVISIMFPIAASIELKKAYFSPEVWNKYLTFLTTPTNASTALQMGVSLFASLFFFEISENIGSGILYNFFTGKYHKPCEEERIFMFLDMKSSTTFAEKLGHLVYFEMLKDYYNNLSDGIVDHGGIVYQYVGDEIVISWRLSGPKENAACIHCFFAMKAALDSKSAYYMERYGVVPEFKAGVHVGKVTVGEVGALKKEITFTGDVLNTTSRIQSLCNTLSTDLLISETLLQCMVLDDEYKTIPVGTHALKGKEKETVLLTVTRVSC